MKRLAGQSLACVVMLWGCTSEIEVGEEMTPVRWAQVSRQAENRGGDLVRNDLPNRPAHLTESLPYSVKVFADAFAMDDTEVITAHGDVLIQVKMGGRVVTRLRADTLTLDRPDTGGRPYDVSLERIEEALAEQRARDEEERFRLFYETYIAPADAAESQ
jgi:hypothetical protein